MATKKTAARTSAGDSSVMTPAETDGIARLITHTARMNLQVEQGRSGKSHDERGFTPIIDGYKARWSGLSKAQQKAAIDYAKEIHDMTPALVKAAVETLED